MVTWMGAYHRHTTRSSARPRPWSPHSCPATQAFLTREASGLMSYPGIVFESRDSSHQVLAARRNLASRRRFRGRRVPCHNNLLDPLVAQGGFSPLGPPSPRRRHTAEAQSVRATGSTLEDCRTVGSVVNPHRGEQVRQPPEASACPQAAQRSRGLTSTPCATRSHHS